MEYKLETIVDGFLVQEEINVVRMPRGRFLGIVNTLLTEGLSECRYDEESDRYEDVDFTPITDEILPVAETMIRFPMGTWINARRGCGCIVGEYIVATGEIDRHNLAILSGESPGAIDTMIRNRPNGDLLREFGEMIDERLRDHLIEMGVDGEKTAWQDDADIVQAIEIID